MRYRHEIWMMFSFDDLKNSTLLIVLNWLMSHIVLIMYANACKLHKNASLIFKTVIIRRDNRFKPNKFGSVFMQAFAAE